jgi:hypothetical protein
LVNHKEFAVFPSSDAAAKQPLSVAVISDDKLLINFICSKVGFCLGVRYDEKVVDAACGNGESRG